MQSHTEAVLAVNTGSRSPRLGRFGACTRSIYVVGFWHGLRVNRGGLSGDGGEPLVVPDVALIIEDMLRLLGSHCM